MPKPTPSDDRVIIVAVIPADLARRLEQQFGDRIRDQGDMFTTDLIRETEAELSDEQVVVEVRVRKRKERV